MQIDLSFIFSIVLICHRFAMWVLAESVRKHSDIMCTTFPTGEQIQEFEVKFDNGKHILCKKTFARSVWGFLR